MQMSNFFNQKVLAILKVKNRQFTFSKPAPEASPVLTLGITCKGQVRTTVDPVWDRVNQLSFHTYIVFHNQWPEGQTDEQLKASQLVVADVPLWININQVTAMIDDFYSLHLQSSVQQPHPELEVMMAQLSSFSKTMMIIGTLSWYPLSPPRGEANPSNLAKSEYIWNQIVPLFINQRGIRTIQIRFFINRMGCLVFGLYIKENECLANK